MINLHTKIFRFLTSQSLPVLQMYADMAYTCIRKTQMSHITIHPNHTNLQIPLYLHVVFKCSKFCFIKYFAIPCGYKGEGLGNLSEQEVR